MTIAHPGLASAKAPDRPQQAAGDHETAPATFASSGPLYRVRMHPDDLAALVGACQAQTPVVEDGSTIILAPVPRVALSKEEAAKALGIGRTCFNERVSPEIKRVQVHWRDLCRCGDDAEGVA